MVQELIINNQVVTCCDDCPRNKEYPNPLWARLAPAHYCIDCFDIAHKEGHPITFSRYTIPTWCPHVP